MPTSNRIILTDVDGVLLEWEHHFTKWMLQKTLFDDRGSRYHPHRLLPDKENTYEMAERFLSLVPQHDMIKYAKNGSVVTTAAIKLARAATGRNIVARTAEHPFYSYDDWFIGSTNCDFGVPREVKNMTVTFKHNNLDDLERMFQEYPGTVSYTHLTLPTKA